MSLRNIFLFLAASNGRVSSNDTNDRDPEVGLKIHPEDTFERSIDPGEALNQEEADYAEEHTAEDVDPNTPRRRRRLSSATAFTSFSKSLTLVETPTWFQSAKN